MSIPGERPAGPVRAGASVTMGSSRFKFQLAVLLASLAFILTILGVYAYVGISYSEGQGLPWDRRRLAGLIAQLEQAHPRRLRLWIARSGSGLAGEAEAFPLLPGPPAGVS